jgi:hypothetical protein
MKFQLVLWIVLAGAAVVYSAKCSAQDESERVQMFEELDPIEDADPDRRHPEKLWMPSVLFLESGDIGTLVAFDSISVHEVEISVGHKMVVGCEWILYYFNGTEKVEVRRNLGGSLGALFGSGRMVIQDLNAIAESRGSLQLIAQLTLFETDIPMQHAWNPKEGRYRALWRGLATGLLTGSRRP